MADAHLIARDDVFDRARHADRDALAELWRIYHPQLLRFLRGKRADAVDDVASQVWIDVGRGIADFAGGGREFQRWIFTIAHRRSIDEHRRAARRRETLVDPSDHETIDPQATRTGDDSVDAAIEMVASLPSQMAEAVLLRVVYEFTVEETAAVMSVSPANVRVLTHRGLTKLRLRFQRSRPTTGDDSRTGTDEQSADRPNLSLARNL